MPEVIEAIDRGEISFHVGKILSNVKDVETRKEVLQDAIQGASGSDIKAKINQRQEDAQKEGKVIKAQHRKKDTATKASVSPLGVRKDKELLEAVSKLSTERNTLAALEDEVSANSVLDIEIALKVLQWVLNPSDTTDVVTLLLGLNQD
jgi:hypothetical protein